jgi:hypothetical protein
MGAIIEDIFANNQELILKHEIENAKRKEVLLSWLGKRVSGGDYDKRDVVEGSFTGWQMFVF